MEPEEIWTLDYEAAGAQAVALEKAMNDFLPELRRKTKIQRMNVLFERGAKSLRMRVDIVSNGDPFDPPWPTTFKDTQIGRPRLFQSQPELSITRT